MTIRPTIIIDTREQNPWTFPSLPTEPATLDTGDYSVKALEHLVSVERKNLSDLIACVGTERARFKRELQRLRAYRFRCLIVESDASVLERGGWRSQVKPSHVLGSLAAWTVQYALPIWLAGDHAAAGRFAEKFLYQAARCVATECEAVNAMVQPEAIPA